MGQEITSEKQAEIGNAILGYMVAKPGITGTLNLATKLDREESDIRAGILHLLKLQYIERDGANRWSITKTGKNAFNGVVPSQTLPQSKFMDGKPVVQISVVEIAIVAPTEEEADQATKAAMDKICNEQHVVDWKYSPETPNKSVFMLSEAAVEHDGDGAYVKGSVFK